MDHFRTSCEDRELFKRCRRAWDFGARARKSLQPRPLTDEPGPPTLEWALRKALDVYYYPGMWTWGRSIVVPLVHRALDDAMRPPGAPPAPGEEVALGHQLIDAYASWAPDHDHFTSIEVSAEITVDLPDPILWDRSLATLEGGAVSYSTWLDALVLDEDTQPWLLRHRITRGPFADPEVLALDEEALTDCWAWWHFALGPPMAGARFNQIRIPSIGDDGVGTEPFRRQNVEYSAEELASAGRQLATEAMDMIDAGLVLYPNPTLSNCTPCPFRGPCRAVRAGQDPSPLLEADYQARPPEARSEGRLNGRTWSTSRGFRPNRFGESPLGGERDDSGQPAG